MTNQDLTNTIESLKLTNETLVMTNAKLVDRLKDADEVIEFYANKENYNPTDYGALIWYDTLKFDDVEKVSSTRMLGGKRARTYLTKWKEK